MQQYFSGLDKGLQKRILGAKLTIYICEGEGEDEEREREIKEWFKTINIAGEPLNEQELRNAIYSGAFVTAAKEEFGNSNNANLQKWKSYVKGNEKRQEIFALTFRPRGSRRAWAGVSLRRGAPETFLTLFRLCPLLFAK